MSEKREARAPRPVVRCKGRRDLVVKPVPYHRAPLPLRPATRHIPAAVGIALALLLDRPAAALDLNQQPFNLRRWERTEGAFATAQGPDGQVWIGLDAGLTRFDGSRFVDVDFGTKTAVRRVLATSDGAIWLATGSSDTFAWAGTGKGAVAKANHLSPGTLLRVDRLRGSAAERVRRFAVPAELPSEWVWALAEDPQGGIWIGTEAGLVRFDGRSFQRFSKSDGLPSDFVTSLMLGPDGAMWVGTTGGVVVRRGGRFEPTGIREAVLETALDRSGTLWAVVVGHIVWLDAKGDTRRISYPTASSLRIDRDDNVWVGSAEGLELFTRTGAATPEIAKRLGSAIVRGLSFDREGSLWLATEGGVVHVSVPRVRNFGPAEGLAGPVAFALLRARDGATFVSALRGLSRYKDGVWKSWLLQKELPGWTLRDLTEGFEGTPNAGVWVANSNGILHSEGDGFGLVPWSFGKGNGGVLSVVATKDGDLWVSSTKGGVSRLQGADLTRAIAFTAADGICAGPLAKGFQTKDGSLWFVNDYASKAATGVTRVKEGRARCYGTADGLPNVRIGSMAEDRDGELWFGTDGAGLVRLQGDRFVVVAPAGLPAVRITGLVDDGAGNLWFGSLTGVTRVSMAELRRCADTGCERLEVATFGKDEGMREPNCTATYHPNMVRRDDGSIWVATLGGVSAFVPAASAPRAVVVPIVDEFAVDGVPVTTAPEVRVRAGQTDLAIHYTAPTFLGPGPPRLAHRLRGHDADWEAAPPQTVAHYQQLPPGAYTLELRAAGADRVVQGVAIVVTPPFWRSGWFVALAVGAAAALGFGLHRLRIRALKGRQRAINDERVRIARDLHDGLAQKFTAMGLLVDGVASGQRGDQSEKLTQVRRILGETHAELRRAVWDMREGTEGQPRLETLVERVLARAVVPAETSLNLRTAESSMPVSGVCAHEVPLVVQEALTNALRHARATQIEVGVLSDEDGVYVWVKDDGCGTTGTGGTGCGIIGMHERARRLDGQLTFRSAPGAGTEVSLFVPRVERAKS
jgi:signal transduction histidine kinase/ligand-binding sensor domain-containing protein